MKMKEKLIEDIIARGVLKTPSIIEAFRNIDRADFVSPGMEDQAYFDIPLPIGKGQTISQPRTVAFMLELLQPHFGDKVLDVGSGSGWQTALLAYIVSHRPEGEGSRFKPGQVIAVEVIPQMCELSVSNVDKYNYIDDGVVKTYCMNASAGVPDEAPFDRVIAAASAARISKVWKNQLSPGGCVVAPVDSSIVALYQKDEGTWEKRSYPGFAFVPFVEE